MKFPPYKKSDQTMGNAIPVVKWNNGHRGAAATGSALEWFQGKLGDQDAWRRTKKQFDLMPSDKQAALREVFGSENVFGDF